MAINVKLDLELAYAAWLADEERTRQENVVIARNYFDGEHNVLLSERQKEYLGFNLDEGRFSFNYCATIVKAVYERMIVMAFEPESREQDKKRPKKPKSEKEDKDPFSAWAWNLWNANRMDAKQTIVHKGAVCDGEYFVFVDWDKVEERPTFIPHQRYTAAEEKIGGDNFGCKAFYPDDDVSQPMEKATKRWTEKIVKPGGERETRRRMTIYYPDRIEKWIASTKDESGWEPFLDQEEDEEIREP